MKQALKNILKGFPGIKQYLARMDNLEGSLRFEINETKSQLKTVDDRLAKCKNELNETKSELNKTKIELAKTKNELARVNRMLTDNHNALKEQHRQLSCKVTAVDNKVNREVGLQKNVNTYLKTEFKNVRKDIDYKYYKGLHPDNYEFALKEWYRSCMGKELDLENPKTYTEKMQWLKLYDVTDEKTRLADKYAVREWVKEKVGEEYLIPLLGVWDNFEDIDFDALPNSFVLKATHGSGYNIVVKDKNDFDIEDARAKFQKWMGTNFAFVNGLELQYKNIKPRIIAEEYMEEMDSLNDYKFMCFDGKVGFIWVDVDRFTNHKRTLFTPQWEKIDARHTFENADYEIPKPVGFEKMKNIAEKLSVGFCHVRVDFYNVEGKIYFGEMTFSSDSGRCKFKPEEFDLYVGNMLTLPDKK